MTTVPIRCFAIILIDRFRCLECRMDYCQYRYRQSCGRHADTVYSIVVKSQICIRVLLHAEARNATKQSSSYASFLEILHAEIEAGTSFANQPRPRSLPSMSWQFVFVYYQWHPHRHEWPRLSLKINLV